MEPLIVRKAAANLYIVLALAVLLLLVFVYIFYQQVSLVMFLILAVLSIFPVWLFIYALRELIKKTPQLTFTQDGLTIKTGSFYAWENMDDFTLSSEAVGSDNAGSIYKNYITLSLKDGTAAKVPVSHLDKTAEEILYLLGAYKRRSADIREL